MASVRGACDSCEVGACEAISKGWAPFEVCCWCCWYLEGTVTRRDIQSWLVAEPYKDAGS